MPHRVTKIDEYATGLPAIRGIEKLKLKLDPAMYPVPTPDVQLECLSALGLSLKTQSFTQLFCRSINDIGEKGL